MDTSCNRAVVVISTKASGGSTISSSSEIADIARDLKGGYVSPLGEIPWRSRAFLFGVRVSRELFTASYIHQGISRHSECKANIRLISEGMANNKRIDGGGLTEEGNKTSTTFCVFRLTENPRSALNSGRRFRTRF